jgi:GDP-mannose 6-dehydrogenase
MGRVTAVQKPLLLAVASQHQPVREGRSNALRVSVFGLGYVGTVCAACLAQDRLQIIGVDPVRTKVDLINAGKSPIIEAEIGELIARAVESGLLRATDETRDAVENSELSFVCVGTPSQINGNLDLMHVRHVCEQIGRALRDKRERHAVVVRSTVLPGTMRKIIIPVLEEYSGKKAGIDFGVCNNPEFLREGSAVEDFRFPSKTVVGELDPTSGDALSAVYANLHVPIVRTDLETAEMIKYIDNSWHALKIGFANEIGVLCKSFSVDAHRVMEIFFMDTKLNISPAYLMPGFAFGGSCLPKDLRALAYAAKLHDLELPILDAILPSNDLQVARGLKLIMDKGKKRIGILGFSFKAGTDDLRESPMIEIIERLAGKGYDLRIYDRNVQVASLVGANRDFILNRIPHISRLMVDDMGAVLQHAETIVIGHKEKEFESVPQLLREGQSLVDFVRIANNRNTNGAYDGICW